MTKSIIDTGSLSRGMSRREILSKGASVAAAVVAAGALGGTSAFAATSMGATNETTCTSQGAFNCVEIHTKLSHHLGEVLHNPDIDAHTRNFQLKSTRCPLCEQQIGPNLFVM